ARAARGRWRGAVARRATVGGRGGLVGVDAQRKRRCGVNVFAGAPWRSGLLLARPRAPFLFCSRARGRLFSFARAPEGAFSLLLARPRAPFLFCSRARGRASTFVR